MELKKRDSDRNQRELEEKETLPTNHLYFLVLLKDTKAHVTIIGLIKLYFYTSVAEHPKEIIISWYTSI